MRSWFSFGFGTGFEAIRVRFFSRPPLVLMYCQVLAAVGGKVVVIVAIIMC